MNTACRMRLSPAPVTPAPNSGATRKPRARRSTTAVSTGSHPGANAKRAHPGAPSSRFRPLLVGRKRDFALLLEARAAAAAGDAILRLARSASDFAAARTHPVDCADHQLARAHAGYSCIGQASPPVTTDIPSLRPRRHSGNSIEPMDRINPAYSRGLTGAGNHGAMACHSGEVTTCSTGATCDSCTWRRMLCCVVSSPRHGTAA